MIPYLIIIIVMIVIHKGHHLVEEKSPLIRSWLDPNDLILKLQQQKIQAHPINYQNGQIQIKAFLMHKPEVFYFLKIIFQPSTILLKSFLNFDMLQINNLNSILLKQINALNQNTFHKFSIDTSRREIVCCSSIQGFWDKNSRNRIGKFWVADPTLIIEQILKIDSQFSKIISEYCKNWQEKQNKILSEFKYFRKYFELERISRKDATKISDLELPDIQPAHNITHLFNATHDKRKIYKNFEKNRSHLENKPDKRQILFFAKLNKIVNCFTSFSETEKYDEEEPRSSEQENKILRGVIFHHVVEHSDYEQQRGYFSSIKKCTSTFMVLRTTNQSSQALFDKEKSVILSEQLIRKQAKEADHQFLAALQIQIKALSQLKQQSCRQIASYFLNVHQKSPKKSLYSKYYPTQIHQIKKTKQKILILADLCLGLKFLGENNLVHRDLKPDNLRVERKNKNNYIKMIDFGSSCPVYGTPQWSLNYNYSVPRTTRGYSVQFCEAFPQIQNLLTKQQFDQHPLYDIYAFGKIVKEYLSTNIDSQESTSKALLNYLIGKCTQLNPADRLNPNQLLLLLYYIFSLE